MEGWQEIPPTCTEPFGPPKRASTFRIQCNEHEDRQPLSLVSNYAADHDLGWISRPQIHLALVVAASSAFPPFLSPLRLRPPGRLLQHEKENGETVQLKNAPRRLWLTDGGVYDNLGLQAVARYDTVLASDGGRPFDASARILSDWLSQTRRALEIMDSGSRRQRRRRLVAEFQMRTRLGMLWSIDSPIHGLSAPNKLPCPAESVHRLATVPTRLKAMPVELRAQLINWGYAAADAHLRTFVEPGFPAPTGFPYPNLGIG